MEDDYAAVRPRVFGAILDLLSMVLAELPNVHLERLPRMADFARVLAAMDRVHVGDGGDKCDKGALDFYLGQRERIAETVIESAQRGVVKRWPPRAGNGEAL